MTSQSLCTAFGVVLAVAVAAPGAQAQTVITRQISDEPLTTVIAPRPSGTLIAAEPLVTVPSGTLLATPAPANIQTVETVQTVRTTPAAHIAACERAKSSPRGRPSCASR